MADIPFKSFFMAGFECSSHRRLRDGARLDLIAATGHDRLVRQDYRSCAQHGLLTIRDGLRWHLIEREPGRYDWSSWLPMLEAAAESGVQVMWDLFHYGSPDHLDQGSPEFSLSYARFAAAAVRLHREVTGTAAIVCPLNEISFLSWAAKNGVFPAIGGNEEAGWLGRHLVGTAIAGMRAMRAVDADCRFIWAEPLINVLPRTAADAQAAEAKRLSQYHAYDMLSGRIAPELGGSPDWLDAVGVNFYSDNQWYLDGSTIPLGHHDYHPLADMLAETYQRYGRPLLISETGGEGSARPAWFHYVCDEVREAIRQGVPVQGVCLYPIVSFPGWDDERHRQFGLFSVPRGDGTRDAYQPLVAELSRQQQLLAREGKPRDVVDPADGERQLFTDRNIRNDAAGRPLRALEL
jgi:beta-glucosidase/6-phospho-beta-glucosidase/beta-galactosidase